MCALLAAATYLPGRAFGQTDEQIRLAFRNIRSDDIPYNAATAAEWIYVHRNKLKNAMLDEVYRTDRQGRDVLLNALFVVDNFEPDEKFRQLTMSRLHEEDNYISYASLGFGAHWNAWPFLDRHYDAFRPLVLENLQTSKNMWYV